MVSTLSSITAFEVPVASLKIDQGRQLSIFPRNSGASFDEAKPFSIERNVKIERWEQNPFFDPTTKLFQLKLSFPDLAQTKWREAKQQIAQYYSVGTTTIKEEQVFIRFLPINAYEVLLDTTDSVVSIEIGPLDQGPYNPPIRVNKRIEDENIERALTDETSALSIKVRIFSIFALQSVNTIVAEKITRASIDAYEKVFGTGSRGKNFIVNRQVNQAFEQELSEQVNYVELTSIPNADISALRDFIEESFKNSAPITLTELQSATDSLIIYSSEEAKVEIEPDEYKDLTTSWEKHSDVAETIEKTWDKFFEIESESETLEKFYNNVRDYIKGSASVAGSVGIGSILNIKPDAKVKFEKEFTEISNQERKDVQKFRQTLKDIGSEKESYMKKAVEKWTGEDYEAGKLVKALDLFKVTYSEITQKLVVRAQQVHTQGTQAKGELWDFPFSSLEVGPSLPKIKIGSTEPDDWKEIQLTGGNIGIFVDVDTSSAGFITTPLYLTSIYGLGGHWRALGVTAIENPTSTGFRVTIQFDDVADVITYAKNQKWTIHWAGIEN